ncbi:MAG: Membrane protein involved in the export of O-antigen and teichoic acid (Modular protein) [Nitrospira sp.]|nr:MAG: Membrane protein involved in the export of O-antigen and teichoic acid (Modular protein) [Nitrospira sp.]
MSALSTQSGRHLLDGTARVFLAGLLLPLTGIITAAFLTRRLGADGYGLLVLSTTLFGWVELTINAFFSRATIRLVGVAADWRPVGMTVIRLHVLAGVVGGLLLGLLAIPLSWLFQEPELASYLALYAFHVPISSLSQGHQNILIGKGNFRQKAMSNAGRWIARLGLILFLVEIGLSVPGAILGSLGAAAVELAITRRYITLPLYGRIAVPTRPFFDLGILLGFSALLTQIFSSLGVVMLKALGGTIEEVGVYGAAQNLSILPSLFGVALSPLLLSTVSRLLSDGKIAQAKDMGRGALRVVAGLLPFGALVAGSAREIVIWVFGVSFESAAPLLALLILGAVAFVMVSVASVIATASGVPRFALHLSLFSIFFGTIASYVFIRAFGAFGAATATALCQVIGAMVSVGIIYRLWAIVPPAGTLWRSAIISVLVYTLALVWPVSGFLLLVKLAAISAVILLAYLTLGELSQEEISQARSFLSESLLVLDQKQKS